MASLNGRAPSLHLSPHFPRNSVRVTVCTAHEALHGDSAVPLMSPRVRPRNVWELLVDPGFGVKGRVFVFAQTIHSSSSHYTGGFGGSWVLAPPGPPCCGDGWVRALLQEL